MGPANQKLSVVKGRWGALWSLALILGASCHGNVEPDHHAELAILVASLAAEGPQDAVSAQVEAPHWVAVAGGTYSMGSTSGDADERPVHSVTVDKLWVSATEVTQAQYTSVMGTNPSLFTGTDHPVDNVTWLQAIAYCNELSRRIGLTPAYTERPSGVLWDPSASGVRLPTEAEWEWLARGGAKGTGSPSGWTNETSGGTSHPVAALPPNGLGLFDLVGNVWEWCWDWYGPYPSDPVSRPLGPSTGTYRVGRGGTWALGAYAARVTNRVELGTPGYHNPVAGFRVVRNAGPGAPP